MIQFEIGDIVKVINSNVIEETYYSPCNLFMINELKENMCVLNGLNNAIFLENVRPVKINDEDDREIYLRYPAWATIVIEENCAYDGEPSCQYYMDVLKEKYPLVYAKVCAFEYVHEVQHYFREIKDFNLSLYLFSNIEL